MSDEKKKKIHVRNSFTNWTIQRQCSNVTNMKTFSFKIKNILRVLLLTTENSIEWKVFDIRTNTKRNFKIYSKNSSLEIKNS